MAGQGADRFPAGCLPEAHDVVGVIADYRQTGAIGAESETESTIPRLGQVGDETA